jgi:protein-S-isoprenylcysteine O-methyltransferase Ste14
MKATDFEYRHQTLIHLLIVGVAFLTYLIDRDDIVWALVRGQSHPRLLERLLFAIATVFIGAATVIRTWAGAYPDRCKSELGSATRRDGPYRYLRYPRQLGSLLYSIGLGFLAPLPGFIFLIAAEAMVALRLMRREEALRRAEAARPASANETQTLASRQPVLLLGQAWKESLRQESAKWGLFLTMIVFTLLLQDRVAEVLAGVSFLVWVVLNCRSFQLTWSR